MPELKTTEFTGVVFRAHHPKWAYSPLSGEDAKRHGGRFNRPGLPALYTSLDPTTAWLEAQQGFPYKPQPMTLVAYEARCLTVVDLNDPPALQGLSFSAAQLACPWEDMATKQQDPPTWQLADKLVMEVSGILVRSFAFSCTSANQNLVLWRWPETGSRSVRIIDDFGRLLKNTESWEN